MNKINFQNLPSTSTPLNASNLNQLQTNVENEFTTVEGEVSDLQGDVLYETANGSNSNIILSQNISNYSYVEVFGHRASNRLYTKFKYVSGNNYYLNYSRLLTGSFYTYALDFSISGTTLTRGKEGYIVCANREMPSVSSGSTDIYIDKVIGYK